MRLYFELALIQRMLTHAKNASEHRPTFDQMCDGQFRRDGKTFDFDGSSADSPTSEDVDPAKVPPGFGWSMITASTLCRTERRRSS
jgi:hypothetical protein